MSDCQVSQTHVHIWTLCPWEAIDMFRNVIMKVRRLPHETRGAQIHHLPEGPIRIIESALRGSCCFWPGPMWKCSWSFTSPPRGILYTAFSDPYARAAYPRLPTASLVGRPTTNDANRETKDGMTRTPCWRRGRRGWPRRPGGGEVGTSPETGTTRLAAASPAEERPGT
jgi:hypothetical protein